MAPGLTDTAGAPVAQASAAAPHQQLKTGPVSKALFPDGLKTTGQHPPIYDLLQPYENFPKEISGPTVWKPEEYVDNPEKWTHRFTEEEIAELSQAADVFIESKVPLTGISKVCRSIYYPLPPLPPALDPVLTSRIESIPPPEIVSLDARIA